MTGPTRTSSPRTSGGCPSATTSPPTAATSIRADKLAMIREDSGGQRPRDPLGRAAGGVEPVRQRAARARRRARRPRRDAAAADAGDRRRLLRHLEGRGDPAVDVGPLRRRGHRHRVNDSQPKVLVTNAANADRVDGRAACCCSTTSCWRAAIREFETVDTAADDPAQLYYSSGTTGLAKGILHAHRYILAHEEFIYCHEVQDGELFHGMGEWAWAAGIAPLLGPWRLGAVQFVLPARGRLRPRTSSSTCSRGTGSRTSSRRRRRCAR